MEVLFSLCSASDATGCIGTGLPDGTEEPGKDGRWGAGGGTPFRCL